MLRYVSRVTAAVLVSATLLSACGRNDNRTAGEKVDDTIAKAEQKGHEVASDVREAGRDARQAAGNTSDTVADKSMDMAITTEVKAHLAGDPQLSALAINVDTVDGRVVMHGSAPDAASRGRATEIARAVEGVVSVSNELTLQTR
jgi:osmotically-inducible protein OsmY